MAIEKKTDGHERPQIARGPWSRYLFDPGASIPPEEPIYQGLLTKGDLAIWLGREKHRKSNVLLQFAICAALGRDFLHFRFAATKPLKVAVLDYESKSQTLKQRHDAIVKAMGLSDDEQRTLRSNLRILEMRRAFRQGMKLARFPVKQERWNAEQFKEAEQEWRSFIQETAADLYIVDPMRCMHAQAENDSPIETLLSRVHEFFGAAAVAISHHLRKRERKPGSQPKLSKDMRAWADEARGSGAITAHADVIICQERVIESDLELLYLGAYLRDGADIEPMPLRESAVESFLWQVVKDAPPNLIQCLDVLVTAQEYANRAAVAAVLETSLGVGRSTAYSRVGELIHRGLLTEMEGMLRVTGSPDQWTTTLNLSRLMGYKVQT